MKTEVYKKHHCATPGNEATFVWDLYAHDSIRNEIGTIINDTLVNLL
jgi:hypothetical protein